jgi:chaperonin GroES
MSNKPNIQPIGMRVLTTPVVEGEQMQGGILLPDSAKERPQEVEVLALGTGENDMNGNEIPFKVKVGDKILISKYGGEELNMGGEKYKILQQNEIVAIIG